MVLYIFFISLPLSIWQQALCVDAWLIAYHWPCLTLVGSTWLHAAVLSVLWTSHLKTAHVVCYNHFACTLHDQSYMCTCMIGHEGCKQSDCNTLHVQFLNEKSTARSERRRAAKLSQRESGMANDKRLITHRRTTLAVKWKEEVIWKICKVPCLCTAAINH